MSVNNNPLITTCDIPPIDVEAWNTSEVEVGKGTVYYRHGIFILWFDDADYWRLSMDVDCKIIEVSKDRSNYNLAIMSQFLAELFSLFGRDILAIDCMRVQLKKYKDRRDTLINGGSE